MGQDFLLAADVGASHTRLRLSTLGAGGAVELRAETRSRTGALADLEAAVRGLVADALGDGGGRLRAAALGLPGKISQDRRSCALSYLDPDRYIGFAGLLDGLGVERWTLLNDLECGTLAVPRTAESDLQRLCGPATEAAARNRRFVLGMPGTGLGLGFHLEPLGAQPSEGGHLPAMIDPDDETEMAVWRRVGAPLGAPPGMPVVPTYESLVRGRAIPAIYRVVVELRAPAGERGALLASFDAGKEGSAHAVEALALSDEGAAGRCAREAFEYYGRFLGRAMQSAALMVMASSVYLGGGIAAATHPLFRDAFVASFQSHGVHGRFLEGLPVHVVLDRQLNLEGATWEAARLAAG